MADISNAAYIGGTGSLAFADDDYTAAVTSFALVPTTPKVTTRDIGGGVTTIVGKPAWAAQVTYNQDWTTTDSFSQKLIDWHGTVKEATYTPASGGVGQKVNLVIESGQIGGASDVLHSATVTIGINGQPTEVAAAT